MCPGRYNCTVESLTWPGIFGPARLVSSTVNFTLEMDSQALRALLGRFD